MDWKCICCVSTIWYLGAISAFRAVRKWKRKIFVEVSNFNKLRSCQWTGFDKNYCQQIRSLSILQRTLNHYRMRPMNYTNWAGALSTWFLDFPEPSYSCCVHFQYDGNDINITMENFTNERNTNILERYARKCNWKSPLFNCCTCTNVLYRLHKCYSSNTYLNQW